MNEIEKIWLPKDKIFSFDDAKKWYNNIKVELNLDFLSADYKKIFRDYYREAGLINNSLKYNFFHRHFSYNFSKAVNKIFSLGNKITILDLGGGAGTQAIFFAILGARVIVVDLNYEALKILKMRQKFYEKLIGRNLEIESFEADVFSFDYQKYGPYDAIYSLFAFNLMQPSKKLLEIISTQLKQTSIIAIQDGNKNMWFNKIFRPRPSLGKREFSQELKKIEFSQITQISGYSIPPIFWSFLPNKILLSIDEFLGKWDILAVSYLHLAKKMK